MINQCLMICEARTPGDTNALTAQTCAVEGFPAKTATSNSFAQFVVELSQALKQGACAGSSACSEPIPNPAPITEEDAGGPMSWLTSNSQADQAEIGDEECECDCEGEVGCDCACEGEAEDEADGLPHELNDASLCSSTAACTAISPCQPSQTEVQYVEDETDPCLMVAEEPAENPCTTSCPTTEWTGTDGTDSNDRSVSACRPNWSTAPRASSGQPEGARPMAYREFCIPVSRSATAMLTSASATQPEKTQAEVTIPNNSGTVCDSSRQLCSTTDSRLSQTLTTANTAASGEPMALASVQDTGKDPIVPGIGAVAPMNSSLEWQIPLESLGVYSTTVSKESLVNSSARPGERAAKLAQAPEALWSSSFLTVPAANAGSVERTGTSPQATEGLATSATLPLDSEMASQVLDPALGSPGEPKDRLTAQGSATVRSLRTAAAALSDPTPDSSAEVTPKETMSKQAWDTGGWMTDSETPSSGRLDPEVPVRALGNSPARSLASSDLRSQSGPPLTTSDLTGTEGVEMEREVIPSGPAITDRAAGGIAHAKSSVHMNKMAEQHQIAASAEQKMPSPEAVADLDPGHPRSGLAGRASAMGPKDMLFAPIPAATVGAHTLVASGNLNLDRSALAPAENAVHSLDDLGRMIGEHAVHLRQVNASSLVVTVKPDGQNELQMHLQLRQGRVEVQVRCSAELANSLGSQWGQLQQSLAGQGIQMGSLNSWTTPSQPESLSASSGMNFPGRDAQSGRQQTREEPPSYMSNYFTIPLRMPTAKTEAARLAIHNVGRWEVWA